MTLSCISLFLSCSLPFKSKKRTLVAVPHLVAYANRLLVLLGAFPPDSPVTRELFEEVDTAIPQEIIDAQNLGYYVVAKERALSVQISRTCVIIKSPV